MNSHLVKIFLFSIVLHATVFFLVLHAGPYGGDTYRDGRNPRPLSSVVAVHLLADKNKPQLPTSLSPATASLAKALDQSMPPEKIAAAPAPPVEPLGIRDFVPAGMLTRRPSPIEVIDLDVNAIDEVAVGGKIELTVLINTDGTVADVSAAVESEDAHLVAARVAERLRATRFTPGEINGKPVRAVWCITVVSEPRQPPEAK